MFQRIEKIISIVMIFFKKFPALFTLLLVLLSFNANAQEPDFSMYHYAPVFTNPGQIGVIEDVRLMLNYRNQSIEVGDSFRSSSLSGFYPVNIGNHRLVFGANFLNDRASEFVTTNGGALGVAYSIRTSQTAELSFGLQGGYFQRKRDNDFTTDDQFVNGGFDPNAPSADRILDRTKGYATLSGGLYYQVRDDEGREKAFVGGAIFNTVEPNISFFDDNEDDLPLTIKATAGYRVYQGMKFSVMPTVRLVDQVDNNFLNLGSRFGYELDNSEEGVKKIELGLWYNTNDLGVFSIAYEQPNLILGVSYDLPVGSDLSEVKNGIFELAVSFRLKSKRRAYVPKQTSTIPLPSEEDTDQEADEATDEATEEVEEVVEEKGEVEEVSPPVREEKVNEEQKEEPVKEVKDEPKERPTAVMLTTAEKEILAKTVRFDFNTGTLDQESKVFLDKVAVILDNRPELNVELIGHSCDIGPERANEVLSHERAESVKRYLVEKGVQPNRFYIKGMGEADPAKDNSTESGRKHTRRVEFKVIN